MKPEIISGAMDGVVVCGRIRLPPEFAWGEPKIAMTASPKRCLVLYRRKDWESVEQKLIAADRYRRRTGWQELSVIRRLMLGCSQTVLVDSRRMIEIPSELKPYADIRKNVRWVTSGKALELWNPDNHDHCTLAMSGAE